MKKTPNTEKGVSTNIWRIKNEKKSTTAATVQNDTKQFGVSVMSAYYLLFVEIVEIISCVCGGLVIPLCSSVCEHKHGLTA